MSQFDFNGVLTGEAEKYFWKKSRDFGLKIMLISVALVSPTFLLISIQIHSHIPITICGCMFVLTPLLVHIPQSRKQKEGFTPRRIYTQDDAVICVAKDYIEQMYIEDIKCIYDHGEFYEIAFKGKRKSDKFICQKSLLQRGSIRSFEEQFEDKLVRVNKRQSSR